MKNLVRLSLLLVVFLGIPLLSLFLYLQNITPPVFVGETFCKSIPGHPSRLIIPAINVNTVIEELGVTSEGEMDVPGSILDVGWFRYGARPGEKGSAVIAGHLDGKNGEIGVFSNLNEIKQGDTLFVEDIQGVSTAFVVRESRIYDPGYAPEVFEGSGSAHLNLVTCEGIWNKNKKSYSKRLIVFADIIN